MPELRQGDRRAQSEPEGIEVRAIIRVVWRDAAGEQQTNAKERDSRDNPGHENRDEDIHMSGGRQHRDSIRSNPGGPTRFIAPTFENDRSNVSVRRKRKY